MIFSTPWPRNIEAVWIEHRNRGLDIALSGLTPAEFRRAWPANSFTNPRESAGKLSVEIVLIAFTAAQR